MTLTLTGEGEMLVEGERVPAAPALRFRVPAALVLLRGDRLADHAGVVHHYPDRPGIPPEAGTGQLPDRHLRVIAASEPAEEPLRDPARSFLDLVQPSDRLAMGPVGRVGQGGPRALRVELGAELGPRHGSPPPVPDRC